MTSFPIPLTTLSVGVHQFGPANVQSADKSATINIDRTVTGGLNTTPTATFDVSLEYSTDSGSSWQFLAGTTGSQGGTDTKNPNVWFLQATLPGVPFELRGSITVHTTVFAVAGSIVLA